MSNSSLSQWFQKAYSNQDRSHSPGEATEPTGHCSPWDDRDEQGENAAIIARSSSGTSWIAPVDAVTSIEAPANAFHHNDGLPADSAGQGPGELAIAASGSSDAGSAGNDLPVGAGGVGGTSVAVAASGDQAIDGILTGLKWSGASITYSDPDAAADYQVGYFVDIDADGFSAQNDGFGQISAQQLLAVHQALNADTYTQPAAATGFAVEAFTGLSISYAGTGTGTATMRVANTSDNANGWTFYPSSGVTGGDVWLGSNIQSPTAGNHAWNNTLHEIGHGLGLKHGQDPATYGALPTAWDSLEFTVMTYRSYVGDPLIGGYSNETWGYPQTYMMLDIAALQYMYGANYTINSGNTVYSWNPTTGVTSINGAAAITPGGNRVFMTIWDGGGIDTYDMSAYTTGVVIDLTPGAWSTTSATQTANLGDGHFARGNVANALLYQDNTASLIENAYGGTGNDNITGNDAANDLRGGVGNDSLHGGWGNDTLYGGDNNDTIEGGYDHDESYGGNGNDVIYAMSAADVNGSGIGDWLSGENGSDTLIGSAGNDTLDGGADFDTDVFLAIAIGASTITRIGQTFNAWQISTASSGSDTIYNVELASFSDTTLTLRQSRGNFNFASTSNDAGATSDFLIYNAAGQFSTFMVQSDAVATTQYLGQASGWAGIANGVGDFNGDGRSDFLTTKAGSILNYTTNAAGNVASVTFLGYVPGWSVKGTGDFDNDGTLDILLQSGSTLAVWDMANGAVNTTVTYGNYAGWTAVAVGDFNRDGRADAFLRDGSGNMVEVFTNGSEAGGTTQFIGTLPNWSIVGSGDFNGDGGGDLLLRDTAGNLITWLTASNGGIVAGYFLGTVPGWSIAGTGDYNGDGTSDVLLQNGGNLVSWDIVNGQLAGSHLVSGTLAGWTAVG